MSKTKCNYIDAAADIAAILVRDAIWTDNMCGWLEQQVVNQQGRNMPAVAACPPDFPNGAGGVTFFLARLLECREQPMLRNVVVAAAERLLLSLTPSSDTRLAQVILAVSETTKITRHESITREFLDQCGRNQCGADQAPRPDESLAKFGFEIKECHSSLTGVYTRIRELWSDIVNGRQSRGQDGSPICLADELIDRWKNAAAEYPCFVDAVVADRFVSIGQLTDDPNWIHAAERIGDHVIEMSDRHGQPWRGPIGFEYPPIGLTGGLAGIGYFLLRVSKGRKALATCAN